MERILLGGIAITALVGLLQTFIGILKWLTPHHEKLTWWDYRQLWMNEVIGGSHDVGNSGGWTDCGNDSGSGNSCAD